jgi:HD-like signal output (HDOD) protein
MLETPQIQGPDGMMVLIEDVNQLVSVSDIYYRLEAAIENPNSCVQDYAKLLSVDPDLCARLLRVANSAFYSFASPVVSVDRAIQRVGLRPIRELVLATTILASFSKQSIPGFDMQAFWTHSLAVSILGRGIARKCGAAFPDTYLIPGLLHDVGQLVLRLRLPQLMVDIHKQRKPKGLLINQLE